MGVFNKEEFNSFVLDNSIVGFFEKPITLKSGRMSNWYVNWRDIAEDVFLMDQLTNYVIAFTKGLGLEPDCFYGVPEGATKLGTLTQDKWAKQSPYYSQGSHVLPMGRGKHKDHGAAKDKYFVGVPKGNVIVLEDVTTTGDSLLSTIDYLIEAKVSIIAAFGLTNRMELRDDKQSVQQAVEAKGIPYHALSNALQLLPLAYKTHQPGEEIAKAIEQEFQQVGVEKLILLQ
ncbi:MAG: hypothetical protein QF362_01860 [Candidatus Woesearchaeota archaeon]|nr:hypothetical protein [Candidatus Woesearchaeota archaeon]MDP7506169.1 hypothetical protein [Candidatus Woesearchaeota archaeon]MDP7610295.1 hypothetical protein [Candidatus Woesearchaeota archaeon]